LNTSGDHLKVRLDLGLLASLLEADLIAYDVREFLKNLLVLYKQGLDEFKVAFNPVETLTVLIEMRNELGLVVDEECHSGR
jgi:hypothetical protein